jgi:hypothetical protein
MNTILLIAAAIAAVGIGIWIGIGAPGWPYQPDDRRRHTERRPLNPAAWGKSASRERQRVKRPEDRRPRLR